MTAILLNFSQRPDLQPLAEIIADVQSAAARAKAEVMIIGAFARDLHLTYGLGINTGRATEDVDLALAISDWTAFGNIKDDLIRTGSPPDGEIVMNVFGFREASTSVSCSSQLTQA